MFLYKLKFNDLNVIDSKICKLLDVRFNSIVLRLNSRPVVKD